MADDLVGHNPLPGQNPGRQAVLDAVDDFKHAFPDLETTIEREVAEGDLVVQYGVMSGTHTGDLMGLPATNNGSRSPGWTCIEIANGQIVESWHLEDIAGMLRQMRPAPS